MKRIDYRKVRTVQPNYFEYTGIYKSEPVEMQLFVYDDAGYEEYKNVSLTRVGKEVADPEQIDDVKWLNMHGLNDTALVRKVGEMVGIETFIMSDILNTNRRSRMEELDEVLYFSIKSVLLDDDRKDLCIEQISFLLKGNLIISFQERRSEFFSHIRERIKTHSGIVRKKKSDYLLFLLLEAVMENFFITVEHYDGVVEKLMFESNAGARRDTLVRIEKARGDLNFMKRSIQPLRDALLNLKSMGEDNDFDGIDPGNYTFFGRLHQKTLELLEQIDYDMNRLDSALSFFFSSQSHRMNEIMKILTAVSVIFMPLTFIVGIYGMNFDFMPELRWKYGYPMVMSVMALLVIVMIFYFKKKKWF